MPLFELVLPPRAAKAAIPVLPGITVAGIALVLVRRQSRGSAPEIGPDRELIRSDPSAD